MFATQGIFSRGVDLTNFYLYNAYRSNTQGKRNGMDKYPTLSMSELTKLKTVLTNAEQNPKYLDGRICPYDADVRELLKSLVPNPIVSATTEPVSLGRKKAGAPRKSVISMGELEKEFDDLRKEIQTLKNDAKGLEPHERIQVVKTRAALIEKILSMKERIGNINKVDKFIATIIGIMEDELPQEARLRVLDKLEPYAEEE